MDAHPTPPAEQPGSRAPGGLQGSAPRRTWLASERTYLAWLRTALAALALAVGVGRLLPALVASSHVAFGLVGAGYGVLGVLILALGAWRLQRVSASLASNHPMPADVWTLWVLTALGIVLAVATIALVIVEV
jgi:putative membrane protein